MPSGTMKNGGSPATASGKTSKCGAANGTSIANSKKVNRVQGDQLSRKIVCQPPNKGRIRGIAA